jgi:hypothetical protein
MVSELIPMAIELHPGLAEKLQSYCVEISKAKRVVDLIRNQKGLQTSGVVAGIRILQSHGEIIKSDLVSLGEDKGTTAAFCWANITYLYSLTQRLADEHELDKVVEKLRSERKCLIQHIRLASVGLSKADGAITVDTKVVKSTDEAVKKVLGKESGLDIALFLARLKRNPDGKSM